MRQLEERLPAVCQDTRRWQVAGAGSRELALAPPSRKRALRSWVVTQLRDLAASAPVVVRSGGAEGFDAALAVTAADLRDDGADVLVVALLPSHDYGDYYWRQHSVTGRDRGAAFSRLLERCDDVAVVADDAAPRSRNAIRNQALLLNGHVALVADPTSRGTSHTFRRAVEHGVDVRVADDAINRLHRARGDLWSLDGDLRVITTNGTLTRSGAGVMGAGVAKDAAKRVADLPERLGEALSESGNIVADLGADTDGTPLASFPVKHDWRDDADLELIGRSATQLREFTDARDRHRVLLPLPGCGNGNLSWAHVWPVLEDVLDDRFILVSRR